MGEQLLKYRAGAGPASRARLTAVVCVGSWGVLALLAGAALLVSAMWLLHFHTNPHGYLAGLLVWGAGAFVGWSVGFLLCGSAQRLILDTRIVGLSALGGLASLHLTQLAESGELDVTAGVLLGGVGLQIGVESLRLSRWLLRRDPGAVRRAWRGVMMLGIVWFVAVLPWVLAVAALWGNRWVLLGAWAAMLPLTIGIPCCGAALKELGKEEGSGCRG